MFSRRGTGPAAAFLHRLSEKHETDETEFLVDASGYLTALTHHELSGQLDYSGRNHVEEWFQTVSMRIDRFTRSVRAVWPAQDAGLNGSVTNITTIDRIKRSMAERQLRRY